MSPSLKGSCLCGGVSIELLESPRHAPEACHCGACRKQTGHFLAAVNIHRSQLKVSGEEHVRWYRSSEQVERGFCGTCGATLFWKPLQAGYEYTAVALGMIDGPTGLKLARHTFVAEKGDYYTLDDGLPQSAAF